MPNWSDGEGWCDCPLGHRAGLGFHRDGEPGCISGPEPKPDLSPPWVMYLEAGKPAAILPAGRLGEVANVRNWPTGLAHELVEAANRFNSLLVKAKAAQGVETDAYLQGVEDILEDDEFWL